MPVEMGVQEWGNVEIGVKGWGGEDVEIGAKERGGGRVL